MSTGLILTDFCPFVENKDLAAFNDGTDRRPFEKLGSFPSLHNGVEGSSICGLGSIGSECSFGWRL